MSNSKGLKDVKSGLRQLVLSGFQGYGKPERNGNNGAEQSVKQEAPQGARYWQQKAYIVTVPVVIEPAGSGSDGNEYTVYIPDDANLLIAPYSARSKRTLAPAFTIHSQESTKNVKVPVVYGISENGKRSLSHPARYTTVQGIANIYSSFLGRIATTIECLLQHGENKAGADDTGKREKGTRPPKSVGATKKSGRGKKVLPEILPEAPTEDATVLVENGGEILGDRHGNGQG